jgi:hypothetical protein
VERATFLVSEDVTNSPWRAHLIGPATRGARVSASLLREALSTLVEAAQRSVRLRVEGRSSAQGPLPNWIEKASAFDLLAIEDGSTGLVFEAKPLLDALPASQLEMFASFDPRLSCLDLLTESLAEAVAGKADSFLYDDGLLTVFERFDRVLRLGIDAVELGTRRALRVDRAAVDTFGRLKRDMPPDRQVIVAGKLDALRHSYRVFRLVLETGAHVQGVIGEGINLKQLATLWGQPARVEGVAKFRPSGSLLRIDAERIEAVSGDVSLWSRMPTPLLRELDTRKLVVPQGPRSGIAAIWGQWPGDESDDELREALAELS